MSAYTVQMDLWGRAVLVINIILHAQSSNTDTTQQDDPMDIDQETVNLPDDEMEIDFEGGSDVEMVDDCTRISSGSKRRASVAPADIPEANLRRKRARMEHGLAIFTTDPRPWDLPTQHIQAIWTHLTSTNTSRSLRQ